MRERLMMVVALLLVGCTETGDPWFAARDLPGTAGDVASSDASGDVSPDAPLPPPTWENAIRPIFTGRGCTFSDCHGEALAGGLDLRTLDGALAGGDHPPTIAPCDPDGSVLVDKLEVPVAFGLVMPVVGDLLTPAEVGLVRAWIAGGADAGALCPQGAR